MELPSCAEIFMSSRKRKRYPTDVPPLGEDERQDENLAGMMTYEEFFTTATGGNSPYGYERRVAGGSEADPAGNFTNGTVCQSQLIEIPIGL